MTTIAPPPRAGVDPLSQKVPDSLEVPALPLGWCLPVLDLLRDGACVRLDDVLDEARFNVREDGFHPVAGRVGELALHTALCVIRLLDMVLLGDLADRRPSDTTP
jgi:hypothetical protein